MRFVSARRECGEVLCAKAVDLGRDTRVGNERVGGGMGVLGSCCRGREDGVCRR